MKLRLRSVETKETLKIEVPNTCTLSQLKLQLSQTIVPSISPASIHVSLNRNDELRDGEEGSSSSLQSFGVTSGDLIFFTLNPSGFASQIPPIPISDTTLMAPVVEPRVQPNQTEEKQFEDFGTKSEGKAADCMEVDGANDDINDQYSVPGFLRKVFIEELDGDDSARDHKLMVIAVHAVLLESGFVAFDPVLKIGSNRIQFKDKWPSTAFMLSLSYTLPEITRVAADCDGNGKAMESVVLKFQSLGKYLNVYGSLANGSRATHWVRLDEGQLLPFLNMVWANCGLGEDVYANYTSPGVSVEKKVFQFWRTAKDKLALPLLIDLCEKTGFELPPCFARLPTDLKLKILESLTGVDVAKVSCVSSELRYLASNDDLWKQKFVEQFGDAERMDEGGRWKEKFVASWESRKRRKMVTRVEVRRAFWGARPNPFMVPRRPRMPRIIGGDYDLMPQPMVHVPSVQVSHPRHGPRCNLGSWRL